ncbi:MAG: glutathione S-transferase family protein [Sphingomonas sp.]|uniref:glutathione S-transferase family protein n=1 Tax=Sphingomonas sp. TaxID=28214 RepID=UPI0011F4FDF6|nr:glutathione S-transferase family protein [Sphingomonas sp.]THD35237.1 MAG: glutathione S-transferase family protein [Sphingomonas sp.]
MLFFNTGNPAPNPRRVRIFAAEKGIELPTKQVEIFKREHKSPEYLAINPMGQTPSLQLDDGSVITESVSICRYLDHLHPKPPMFGADAREAAEIDQMIRRAEMRLMTPIGMVWVHTHPLTAKVVPHQYTEFGESNRPRIDHVMREFDTVLADRAFLAGDAYSMADIVLLTTIDFGKFIGVEMPDEALHLKAWHERVSARPSAKA